MASRVADVLLELDRVSKKFAKARTEELLAVRDVSFKAERGELISIVGPTGCGKSTILRLAAGLEKPTAGSVLFDGKPVVGPSVERGFVFQNYSAFPWLTVRQNIAFGLPSGRRSAENSDVESWLQTMGLSAFAEAFPRDLSGGMRQRLALARSLIVNPKLLLMDEPFGALDEHTRGAVQQLLLDLVAKLQCTVLFVTHDLREAVLLSDRILLLSSRPASILREFCLPTRENQVSKRSRDPEALAVYEALLDAFPI